MKSLVFRRRAERFAQLLNEAGGGRRHHVQSSGDDHLVELVALGHQMSTIRPAVKVDADFRAGLRASLLATAEREGIGATALANARRKRVQPRPGLLRDKVAGRRGRVRSLIIAGVAAGTITVSGMSAASENSLPGDALYGVKRSAERAHLALTTSDVRRARIYLDIARIRLSEAQAIRDHGDGFTRVLDDMDTATRTGARLLIGSAVKPGTDEALDDLTAFVHDQRQSLAALSTDADSADRRRVSRSLSLLDAISQRMTAVRAALACDAGFARSDALGPRPHSCEK